MSSSLSTSASTPSEITSSSSSSDSATVQKVVSKDDEQHATNKVEKLPDTGQSTTQTGLLGGVGALLTGLGLLKKSRKQKDEETSSHE
ncbi:TPA: LPXTG cell wall anchor domain-containing protein [Staphylococcus pseudintermedius]|nr:LPXTG cell wall anchor domain-containing protein [Staphylococcus pseudintermedius]EHD5217870.1 LPXTG cell wall anchor domain-containing protein [Staphylococcus pseudintermedius]EIE3757934.1 LPXTG cell wall anchor domain-containing protein [Staphylococcus pseudintermedius]EII2699932.1 LPXTG cell wall anchor domain-containing protein [Staphylococcus pseudintermedius]MDK3747582.1 LPXTG cell wall anchor domain-containing protein [Staphylococcus pseudintermedius]MDK3754624.1 LPXTG cell wall anch